MARPVHQDSVIADAEFDRIFNLPRRVSHPVNVEAVSAYFRAPGSTATLRQKQAELLYDLYECRGAVGALPTGKGKTIPSFLAATLPHPQDHRRFWVERPVLVVSGALSSKTENDAQKWRAHFKTHPNQKTITYELLQQPNQVKLLWSLMPDLLVFDEAQELRNRQSSRCQRCENYLNDYPNTIVMVLSASFIKRKLADCAHIFWYALRHRSPIPRPGTETLKDWGRALDELGGDAIRTTSPGALYRFCKQGESAKQGFQRRVFMECAGVVTDFTSSSNAALNIFGVRPESIPPDVVTAFHRMRVSGTTLSGDELTDRFSIWARTRELAYGFYYRWVWPDNVPDIEWLQARAEWRRFVRYVLKHNRRGVDTERRVRDAVDQGLYGQPNQGPKDGPGSNGAQKLVEWRRVKDRYSPHPPREAIWVSDFVVKGAAEWLAEGKQKGARGRLCWVEHNAVGEAIARRGDVPYFGGGDDGIERYSGPCVLSMRANAKGRNLQDRYSDNLFAAAPTGGDVWEQAISRTHRDGQIEDTVNVWIFLHCKELWECFEQARRDAAHQQEIGGQEQKLCIATHAMLSEHDVLRMQLAKDPLWSPMEN